MYKASLYESFESRSDECAMKTNSGNCALRVQIGPKIVDSEAVLQAEEATKNICFQKRKDSWLLYSNQMLQEISLDWENFDNQAKLGRPKTVDSETVL